MDWFPPEPTLGWVRWQLDRLVHLRLTTADQAALAADYDVLCALERRDFEQRPASEADASSARAETPPGSTVDTFRAELAPVRRASSARGCGWRRTTPRRSLEGSSVTPFHLPKR